MSIPTVEQLESTMPRLCEIVKYSGHERLVRNSGVVYVLKPIRIKGVQTFTIERATIRGYNYE